MIAAIRNASEDTVYPQAARSQGPSSQPGLHLVNLHGSILHMATAKNKKLLKKYMSDFVLHTATFEFGALRSCITEVPHTLFKAPRIASASAMCVQPSKTLMLYSSVSPLYSS